MVKTSLVPSGPDVLTRAVPGSLLFQAPINTLCAIVGCRFDGVSIRKKIVSDW